MHLSKMIHDKYSELSRLCKAHKVDKVYAFGSSITDHFDPASSDVDVIVKLNIEDPIEYGEALLSFWDQLESLFGRRVDLLTEESITNPYLKKSVAATKKLIYDGQGEKVFA